MKHRRPKLIKTTKMTVHSLHIFDRKGSTLFTKTYSRAANKQSLHLQDSASTDPDTNPLDEQRKLVFGMMFSLKESILKNLTPTGKDSGEFARYVIDHSIPIGYDF